MWKSSFIQTEQERSPLRQTSGFGSQQKSSKRKPLAASLLLTSLVDIFAVLVIYLLVNTSASKEMKIDKGITLPMATMAHSFDAALIIKVDKGGYTVRNQRVHPQNLSRVLMEELKNNKVHQQELIVQADKKVDFSQINPVMLAGSSAGFHKIKFAVIHREEM